VAADVSIDTEKRLAEATVWCQSSNAQACSYSAHVEAFQESGKNNADSEKSCGKAAAGNCALAASAVAAGGDRERQGQALALGFCSDSNGSCRGEFSTHVDSNRDTLSDCKSSGGANGMCVGLAVPEHALSAGRFIGDPDGDDKLTLNSQAPGRDDAEKICSASSRCDMQKIDDEAFKDLEGEFYVLDLTEDKSVGQWFKNFGRDLGDVVVYAVPGLLESVGTELLNTVRYDFLGDTGLVGAITGGHVGFDVPDQKEGESDLEYYTRLYPFTGGVATGAVNFYDRWLKDGGSWDKIGHDYYYAPVSTLLEDVGTVALVAVGAGAIIKGISLGAKGASAASAGLSTSMMSGFSTGMVAARGAWAATRVPGLDAAFSGTMRIAGWTGKVALAPLTVNFAAGRLAAGIVSRGLLNPMAGRMLGAAEVAAGRAGAAFEFGRYSEGIALQAHSARLGRIGGALEIGAYAGRVVGWDGIFGRTTLHGRTPGLIGTLRAYNHLGLRFGRPLTAAEIASASANASARAFAPDALGPRTMLGRLLGHETAYSIRQSRADRASAVARYDQVMFGGTLRNPNRLAGRGVYAGQRAQVLSQIAEGRLSAAEYTSLTRGLDEVADTVTAAGNRGSGATRTGTQGRDGEPTTDAAQQQADGQRTDGQQPDGTPVQQPNPVRNEPAPTDSMLPQAPRSGDRLGGGQRQNNSGGGGADPLPGEAPPGGAPPARGGARTGAAEQGPPDPARPADVGPASAGRGQQHHDRFPSERGAAGPHRAGLRARRRRGPLLLGEDPGRGDRPAQGAEGAVRGARRRRPHPPEDDRRGPDRVHGTRLRSLATEREGADRQADRRRARAGGRKRHPDAHR
jgi:hypothetical protein